MPANIRETLIGLSAPQVATLTPNSTLTCFTKLNAALADPSLQTESDVDEIGKGTEFATQNFKTAWGMTATFEKFITSEWAKFVFENALGAGGVPQDPVTTGIELPTFTVCEQIRPGALTSVIDRAMVGCVIESFNLSIGSGAGRQNSKLTIQVVGTGKLVEPSTMTIPATIAEHFLSAGSAAITINGTNYVTAKNIISLDVEYKNNHRLDTGYYPGSGYQTVGDGNSGQIRGRMEFGTRAISLKVVVRIDHSSTELVKLKAQTEGTAVFSLTGATTNGILCTFYRIVFASVKIADAAGIVTAEIEATALWHATNGLCSFVATVAP